MQRVAARRACGLRAQAEAEGTARGLHASEERGPPLQCTAHHLGQRLGLLLRGADGVPLGREQCREGGLEVICQ